MHTQVYIHAAYPLAYPLLPIPCCLSLAYTVAYPDAHGAHGCTSDTKGGVALSSVAGCCQLVHIAHMAMHSPGIPYWLYHMAYIYMVDIGYTPVQGTTAVALYAGHARFCDTPCHTTCIYHCSQDAPVR